MQTVAQMLRWQALLLSLLLVSPSMNWATPQRQDDNTAATHDPVRRNYLNTSRYLFASRAIVLIGTPYQVLRLSRWLDEIYRVPYGKHTLEAILHSGKQVTIQHSRWALDASGRTLAPATGNLTNGRGEDVTVLFDARIPEHGSHRVFDANNETIEFTAVQNLFHELAHARHLTNGTWRYFDSEGQAIEEENIFRRQLSRQQGTGDAPQRVGVRGVRLWQQASN
jgi:hypothetical protein